MESKNPNFNITDLKSKVIFITNWTLEMAKVNSNDVFTSYGGIEIRLIVKEFKPQVEGQEKVMLSRYPVNIYRDDEMKTLIQSYTHGCVSAAVKSGVKGESLPDIAGMAGKKGSGVVSFASGNNFSSWDFKEGKTPVMDMESVFKLEKGAAALKKLQESSSGKVKVISSAGKGKKVAAGKSGLKEQSKKIQKFTPGGKDTVGQKKSLARLSSGKTPKLPSPGAGASAHATPGFNKKQFEKMVQYLRNKQKKGGKK